MVPAWWPVLLIHQRSATCASIQKAVRPAHLDFGGSTRTPPGRPGSVGVRVRVPSAPLRLTRAFSFREGRPSSAMVPACRLLAPRGASHPTVRHRSARRLTPPDTSLCRNERSATLARRRGERSRRLFQAWLVSIAHHSPRTCSTRSPRRSGPRSADSEGAHVTGSTATSACTSRRHLRWSRWTTSGLRPSSAAAGDPSRLRLLRYLLDEEHCVAQCTDEFGLAQSAVSRHLQRLVNAGLVARRPAGRRTYHRVGEPDAVRSMLERGASFADSAEF